MKYEMKYTDEKILEAVKKCLEEPSVPAVQVAETLGANPEYIKLRLKDLEKRGLLKSKLRGRIWFFGLKCF